jgi:hypothetical protein
VACGGDGIWSERMIVERKKKTTRFVKRKKNASRFRFLLSDHLRERMVEREKQCE